MSFRIAIASWSRRARISAISPGIGLLLLAAGAAFGQTRREAPPAPLLGELPGPEDIPGEAIVSAGVGGEVAALSEGALSRAATAALTQCPGLRREDNVDLRILRIYRALRQDARTVTAHVRAVDRTSRRPLPTRNLLDLLRDQPEVRLAVPNQVVSRASGLPGCRTMTPTPPDRARPREDSRADDDLRTVADDEARVARALGLTAPRGSVLRWTNPTAPNPETRFLSADFTDSDGDGMTDSAERRYGFDPRDPRSVPGEPEPLPTNERPLDGSGIGATGVAHRWGMQVRWIDPRPHSYFLLARDGGRRLFFGGHARSHAEIDFTRHGLDGDEVLTLRFSEYDETGHFVRDLPEFPARLVDFPRPRVGEPSNRVTYSFSANFPTDAEARYRGYLRRLFPILRRQLGPPAESFNCEIRFTPRDGSFEVIDGGRAMLTDATFYPRLIAHEFVHVWKGDFTVTSNAAWEYDPALSAFEEGAAEGMAFELVHEFVRSYPTDDATLVLLRNRPYQYWSAWAATRDMIRFDRVTGAGDFWSDVSTASRRYSISAAAVQDLARQDPGFYERFSRRYFDRINADPAYRPDRASIAAIWGQVVPAVDGVATARWLDAMPVFQGRKLDRGVYVLSSRRAYGLRGDQQMVVSYVPDDGRTYWGIREADVPAAGIPPWVDHDEGDDAFAYIDMQDQPFTVVVRDAGGTTSATVTARTKVDRRPDGTATGLGWGIIDDLDMRLFPLGLYREEVSFDYFLAHDPGSRETFRFIGLEDFAQDPENDYVILVAYEGLDSGSVSLRLGGTEYEAGLSRGLAVFRSRAWRFDTEGRLAITVRDARGRDRTYHRTLLEAGTYHDYFQHSFLIVDRDFDGVEDAWDSGPGDEPPFAALPLPDQSATVGQPFAFAVPAATFHDPDDGDRLAIACDQADGSPLPGWLSFNAAGRVLSGTPPLQEPAALRLRLTATDPTGREATATFALTVSGSATALLTLEAAPAGEPDPPPLAFRVRRGEPFAVHTPAFAGYVFAGWSVDGPATVADPTAMSTSAILTGDATVRARHEVPAPATTGDRR